MPKLHGMFACKARDCIGVEILLADDGSVDGLAENVTIWNKKWKRVTQIKLKLTKQSGKPHVLRPVLRKKAVLKSILEQWLEQKIAMWNSIFIHSAESGLRTERLWRKNFPTLKLFSWLLSPCKCGGRSFSCLGKEVGLMSQALFLEPVFSQALAYYNSQQLRAYVG